MPIAQPVEDRFLEDIRGGDDAEEDEGAYPVKELKGLEILAMQLPIRELNLLSLRSDQIFLLQTITIHEALLNFLILDDEVLHCLVSR